MVHAYTARWLEYRTYFDFRLTIQSNSLSLWSKPNLSQVKNNERDKTNFTPPMVLFFTTHRKKMLGNEQCSGSEKWETKRTSQISSRIKKNPEGSLLRFHEWALTLHTCAVNLYAPPWTDFLRFLQQNWELNHFGKQFMGFCECQRWRSLLFLCLTKKKLASAMPE